jgi:hypothetical protein
VECGALPCLLRPDAYRFGRGLFTRYSIPCLGSQKPITPCTRPAWNRSSPSPYATALTMTGIGHTSTSYNTTGNLFHVADTIQPYPHLGQSLPHPRCDFLDTPELKARYLLIPATLLQYFLHVAHSDLHCGSFRSRRHFKMVIVLPLGQFSTNTRAFRTDGRFGFSVRPLVQKLAPRQESGFSWAAGPKSSRLRRALHPVRSRNSNPKPLST